MRQTEACCTELAHRRAWLGGEPAASGRAGVAAARGGGGREARGEEKKRKRELYHGMCKNATDTEGSKSEREKQVSYAVLSRSFVSDFLQPHGLQHTRLLCSWGFSRQKYWSGLPFPSSGDLPDPRIKPRSPALQVDSLPSELPGKPLNWPKLCVDMPMCIFGGKKLQGLQT